MIIAALMVLPLVGALFTWFVGRMNASASRWVALSVAGVTAVVATVAAGALSGAGERILVYRPVIALPSFALRLDGLSLPLVLLTAGLGIIAVIASWSVTDRTGTLLALLLTLQAAVTAVFLADDLVLFYVAWEAVLIPMFFIIGGWGHEGRRHASMKFFLYTFAGSALMLIGIVAMVVLTGRTDMSGAIEGMMRPAAAGLSLSASTIRVAVFCLLGIGFAVKIPVWPLHTWLPDAHVEAPTAGSIMLAGVLLKMGGYGFLRIGLAVSPGAARATAPLLATLGLIGILYGALMALAQTDLKRLVAYSSVSHMGFLVLALAVATPASLSAAVLTMVAHGVVAGLLFLLVGMLYERTHTRDLNRFGGLLAVTPVFGATFVLAALASAGLPGLAGFPGEIVTFLEGFGAFGWWMLVAAIGVVLAGAYNLRAVRAVLHGPIAGEWGGLADLDLREMLAAIPLAIAAVLLGLFPGAVVSAAAPVLAALAAMLGRS